MLYISRRKGETFTIGEQGEVTILVSKIQGSQVRIGIDAPKDCPIRRHDMKKTTVSKSAPDSGEECGATMQGMAADHS